MDTTKRTVRDAEVATKKALRGVDGHQPSDDIANARDEIGKDLANAGDDSRRAIRNARDKMSGRDDRGMDSTR